MLSHALAVVVLSGIFAGGGIVEWRRAAATDQLASQRTWRRAMALSGFGFATVTLTAGFGMSALLVGVVAAAWAVPVAVLALVQIIAEFHERWEARQRNAALGWPRGKPPIHPIWGMAALILGSLIMSAFVSTGGRAAPWVGNVADAVGFSEVAAGRALFKVWLVGLLAGLLYLCWMVFRRAIWSIRRTRLDREAAADYDPRRES